VGRVKRGEERRVEGGRKLRETKNTGMVKGEMEMIWDKISSLAVDALVGQRNRSPECR
jgi:hypothetical protein